MLKTTNFSNKTLNENSSEDEIRKSTIKEFKEKEIIKKSEHDSYIGITAREFIERKKINLYIKSFD